MEESKIKLDGSKVPPKRRECSKIGACVDMNPDAALGRDGDMELQNMNSASGAGGVPLNARRSLSPQFAMHDDTSMVRTNQYAMSFSHGDGVPDEQSLASSLEGMVLNNMNQAADFPTNAHNNVLINWYHPYGGVMSTSGLTFPDEWAPLQYNAEHTKQRPNELAVEHQEQDQSFPLYFGNVPRSSGMNTMNSFSGTPYRPSPISGSTFQPQFYVDGPSQMYPAYGQHVGSNFSQQLDAQKYPVMQPHYVYPTMQPTVRSNVHQIRGNQHGAVCYNTRGGASAYLGTANVNTLDLGTEDPYWHGTSFSKLNNKLNSTFVNRFPSTLYPDNSCGIPARGVVCPSNSAKLFPKRFLSDVLSRTSYPENIMSAGVNLVRNSNFAPPREGGNDMDHRSRQNCHDFSSYDQLQFDNLDSQFMPLQSEYKFIMTSPQLKCNFNSIDDVVGRICMLAKDQDGCRFLQMILTEGTKEDVGKIFAEIIDHIGELMMDPFGNYLVQKLLKECNEDQIMHIICEITKMPGDLITVSCNMHGTRAVQKLIETTNTPEQVSKVVSALKPGAMRLMTDTNGSHVAHRCLQKPLPEFKEFLLNAATCRYLKLAKDRQGCCIIQKCIEHSNDEQKYILLNRITSNALVLSEDQYGNYVIQFILDLGVEWATTKIVEGLMGLFGYLSMQKFGSHVVEHCLKVAPQLQRDRIIQELMVDPKLPYIMLDQFGNYVIQTALEECKGELHTDFVEAIRPHAASMQSNIFGRKVLESTLPKNRWYHQARHGIFKPSLADLLKERSFYQQKEQ